MTGPTRLFSLLTGAGHVLLVHVAVVVGRAAVADAAGDTMLPVLRDTAGAFADAHSPGAIALHLVRPDGYLSFVSPGLHTSALVRNLELTFAAR